nr:alpha/beta hydrolase [Alcanivorax quisquiliarum]
MVKLFARRAIKRRDLPPQALVAHLRKAFNRPPGITLLPRGVRCTRIETTQFTGDRVATAAPERVILYFHGGAYVAGVTRTYHNLAGRLAQQLNAAVYLPVYPFAPEHPFPAAVNRCLDAYAWLLEEGYSSEQITIGGDSAGGGLTLSTLLGLRDKGLPLPGRAFVFSPASDAHGRGTSLDANDNVDCMLSASMIRTAADVYVSPEQRDNPLASPCLGDYHGMPPLLITVDQDECLYSDAEAVRDKALAAGVKVEWIARQGLFHVWPIMVPWLPEARRELRELVAFIRQH